jgi:hypothetical protein
VTLATQRRLIRLRNNAGPLILAAGMVVSAVALVMLRF